MNQGHGYVGLGTCHTLVEDPNHPPDRLRTTQTFGESETVHTQSVTTAASLAGSNRIAREITLFQISRFTLVGTVSRLYYDLHVRCSFLYARIP